MHFFSKFGTKDENFSVNSTIDLCSIVKRSIISLVRLTCDWSSLDWLTCDWSSLEWLTCDWSSLDWLTCDWLNEITSESKN